MYASYSFQVSIRGVCAHDLGLFLLSTGALCPLRGRASSGGEDGGVGAGRRDGYRGNERFLFGIWCYLRDMRRHWGEPRFPVLLQGLAVKCVRVLFGASVIIIKKDVYCSVLHQDVLKKETKKNPTTNMCTLTAALSTWRKWQISYLLWI